MKGEKPGFLTKSAKGYPTKKAGKSWKTQFVFIKGVYAHERKKKKVFD